MEEHPPAVTGPTGDDLEREKRRPWLALLLGLLALFPFAIWLGVQSLQDRKRAQAEGRPYENGWVAILAIALGAATALVLLAVVAVIAIGGDENPNEGDYLTRAELERSIVTDGEFGSEAQRLRPEAAFCVAEGDDGSRYRCSIDFRGGFTDTYSVTVDRDGSWVAD